MNVQNNKFALLLAASAVSMALTGCGGSDGNDGDNGKPGGPAAEVVNVLNLDVTKVTYQDGTPSITVFATNEEDLPVVGLKDLEVKAVAQLLPQGATGAGDSAQWQKIGSQKAFVDHKNGNYTFDVTLDGYDAELTQRYNVIASASTLQDGVTTVPRTELSEDFSGDGYQALYSKDIVSTQTCNTCHAEGEKIYHGYTSAETCASCHTQEWAEGRGKPEVAFTHMVHNVHNSAKGYKADRTTGEFTKDAKKAHALLQDNCKTCHVAPAEDSDELSEWGNWSRVPTMETCTSCHVNIDFKAGKGHSQQDDNSNCIACHNASWTEELHTDGFAQKKAFVGQYGMDASLSAVATDTGSDTTLSVTITNAEGIALDASALVANIQQLETITNVGPNFPIMGYNPNPAGLKKVAIDFVKAGILDANVEIVDGKFVTVIKDLPYGAGDTDTAFSFVGLALCNDGTDLVACGEGVESTGMKAELAHGTLSGEAPSVRHTDTVEFTACESCHGTEWGIHQGSRHPGFVMTEQLGRVNEAGEMIVGIDGCASCHTPDGTYASGANLGSIEMKLHKTHSQGDYGAIPGMNCSQCHSDFKQEAFAKKGALATDGGYTTPIAATCYSCHSYSGDKFKNHVESQGAKVNADYTVANEAAQLETCFMCHNPSINDHTSVKM